MTKNAVNIAQISDLHIKAPGRLAYRRVDTARALARCITELNRFEPKLDLVVISGDLADTPSPAEYDHLKDLLAELRIPFAAVPGNHDSRELMRVAFPDASHDHPSGPLNRHVELADLDLLLLDSSVPGHPHGEIDQASLQWLDAKLSARADKPALLFLHHPPFSTGIGHMDRQNLRNAAHLAAILTRHPRVQLIGCGHVHRAALTRFAAIPCTICPAPNHAVALDLAEMQSPSFRIEPPAFHLHAWFPGPGFGTIVTHQVPIGDFDGPHPFFNQDGTLID
ncbi:MULTISPECIES: phosphodiesterase [unclassified Bradyrhizobium]|uniref:phosphodiesterase n=1 Tax=unclassified Bradyrhizobium TaxID=2631580 RepID=UPI0028E78177|nr:MULTISPECIES: phosphodiesterase [unclassified Bradyrhizobium]